MIANITVVGATMLSLQIIWQAAFIGFCDELSPHCLEQSSEYLLLEQEIEGSTEYVQLIRTSIDHRQRSKNMLKNEIYDSVFLLPDVTAAPHGSVKATRRYSF